MKNMRIYEDARSVPKTAQKPIGGGRLKGMTDINPMWRIKTLTQLFGPCGTGWYYTIDRMWLDDGGNKEIIANVVISLFYKENDEWSSPVIGIGGSMFTANEKSGIYTDDECYKKALTDAISVSCKALGIGADVYWDKDTTKYDSRPNIAPKDGKTANELSIEIVQPAHIKVLSDLCGKAGWSEGKLIANVNKNTCSDIKNISEMTVPQFKAIAAFLEKKVEMMSESKA